MNIGISPWLYLYHQGHSGTAWNNERRGSDHMITSLKKYKRHTMVFICIYKFSIAF